VHAVSFNKNFGIWVNVANLKLEHNFGPNSESGTGSCLAWLTTYRMDQKFEPGFEHYADLGTLDDWKGFDNQGHQLGPVIQGKLGWVRYDTGFLVGISNAAPDTTVKLNLEYEF